MNSISALALGGLALLHAREASADLEPRRRGFQVDVAGGLSLCLPGGAARCKEVDGATRPHVGGVITLGWRPRSWLLAGLSYEFSLLRPTHTDILGSNGRQLYGLARHHGVFGVLRTGVDIGRLDLGLEVGLGYSQHVAPYVHDEFRGQRHGTRGFAARVTPLLAVYLTRRLYLGLRWDVTLNFHRAQACGPTPCPGSVRAPAFGHHSLLGLMFGVTI